MVKKLSIFNSVSVLLVVLVNYISQVYRLNNTTIGEVSAQYDNLFTPAGYAFSIWGVIFLSLIAYSVFQVRRSFFSSKTSEFVTQTGWWFSLANILNASWVIAFSYDFIGLSVLIMLGILASLIQIIRKTNMECWDAPIEIIAFVWWPICLYSGWITVATIANISAYLTKLGWDGGFLSEEIWTVIMIVAAVIINLLMIIKRNMREFAMVGVWALVAIYIRHRTNIPSIAYSALGGGAILFIASGIHAFKNRATSPVEKCKERWGLK
ncbi:tryptophan-rich sensory protein [Cytophaga sp. FL35]|uniref:tryptophan-rich sensory protein n=1 Tax=Cytophaga sp. FL35 TaxID=1904456 RepID=UPI001653A5DE|nr:tryptophan-rich sensory protein [Cytophaga sp. FL35]MBC6999346.1 tryptophan-rich sensory protein [Cytophaga sp. FL35]